MYYYFGKTKSMLSTLTIENVGIIFGTIIVIVVLQRLVRRFIRRREYRLPPGPARWPVLGNIGLQTHMTLFDHREKYGDISYLNVLGRDIFVFNSVEVVRDALQSADTAEVFSSRAHTFASKYVAPDDVSVRSMDSENWKPQRQMFHTMLKQYGEGVVALERIVTKELEVVVEELKGKLGQDVDMEDYFRPSLINILCILLIGERFDSNHWKVIIGMEMIRTMVKMLDPFVDMVLQTFPFLRLLPFGPGALYRRMCKSRETVMGFLYHDLTKLPFDIKENGQGMVYEMIRYLGKNDWLKDSYIRGVIIDTLGPGFITTDSSLRVFFLVLLHYPDVQTKIQYEIENVVGNERRPKLSDRPNMPYTVAAILELFRYSSIAPMSIPHACASHTEFRGFTVPRDSMIIPNLYRIHHDKSLWKNPWEFDPLRFLDESGKLLPVSHPTRKNLIPFGVGKRLCMGENFAKSRIFLYISYLLQSFNVKPTDDNYPSCDTRYYVPDGVLCPPTYRVRMERR